MIKVLVVDDSTFMRKAIRQMVAFDPEIEVVGEAGDGREAMEKVLSLQPDVITMDIVMPGVDGLWALEEIMKQRPTPVIIFSSLAPKESETAAAAFSLGVVDVLTKPDNPQQIAFIQKELAEKIKAAARVSGVRLLDYRSVVARERTPSQLAGHQALVIATSACGPSSLYEVIPRLSKDFFGTVVVAQHMPAQFIRSFVDHVQTMTPMSVKVADKGDLLYARRVLFSPTTATLEVHRTRRGVIADIVDHHVRLQPDINRVIISCAEAFRSAMVLVVLSGLGDDGVKGAEIVKKYGGTVIVEDESTAGVYSGMPSSVVKAGFCDLQVPSYNIAEAAEMTLAKRPYAVETKKQFMVKGIIVKNTVQYVKNACAPDAAARIVEGLGPDMARLVKENVKQYNYYPSGIYHDLCASIHKQLAAGRPAVVEEVAYENARECFTLYKTALGVSRVDDLKNFAQVCGRILFPGVSVEVLDVDRDLKRSVCMLRSDGFRETHLPISAMIIRGWVAYLFTMLNLAVVENTIESGKDDIGLYIKCVIKWK